MKSFTKIGLFALLLGCVFVETSAKAGPAEYTPSWRWKEPGCFAWSDKLKTYACIKMDASPGETADVSSPRMNDSYEHAIKLRASVVLGVKFASSDAWDDRYMLRRNDAKHEQYDKELSSIAEVRDALRKKGFTTYVPPQHRVPLIKDKWVKIGDDRYRYHVNLSERDASFEYSGTFEIKCKGKGAPQELIKEYALGGPLAMVSWVPGKGPKVLTIEHHDGGEGHVDVQMQHWLFDSKKACQKNQKGS